MNVVPVAGSGRSRLRVMVVEDHPVLQRAIQKILRTDYDVLAVIERGDAVLSAAQHLMPDLIALDISLPGRSGMQVLPELRIALPDAGIVMLTTLVDVVFQQAAFAHGADGFVEKARATTDLLPAFRAARALRAKGKRRAWKQCPTSDLRPPCNR